MSTYLRKWVFTTVGVVGSMAVTTVAAAQGATNNGKTVAPASSSLMPRFPTNAPTTPLMAASASQPYAPIGGAFTPALMGRTRFSLTNPLALGWHVRGDTFGWELVSRPGRRDDERGNARWRALDKYSRWWEFRPVFTRGRNPEWTPDRRPVWHQRFGWNPQPQLLVHRRFQRGDCGRRPASRRFDRRSFGWQQSCRRRLGDRKPSGRCHRWRRSAYYECSGWTSPVMTEDERENWVWRRGCASTSAHIPLRQGYGGQGADTTTIH